MFSTLTAARPGCQAAGTFLDGLRSYVAGLELCMRTQRSHALTVPMLRALQLVCLIRSNTVHRHPSRQLVMQDALEWLQRVRQRHPVTNASASTCA